MHNDPDIVDVFYQLRDTNRLLQELIAQLRDEAKGSYDRCQWTAESGTRCPNTTGGTPLCDEHSAEQSAAIAQLRDEAKQRGPKPKRSCSCGEAYGKRPWFHIKCSYCIGLWDQK